MGIIIMGGVYIHNKDLISSSTATIASISTRAPLGISATARATLEGKDLSGKYEP